MSTAKVCGLICCHRRSFPLPFLIIILGRRHLCLHLFTLSDHIIIGATPMLFSHTHSSLSFLITSPNRLFVLIFVTLVLCSTFMFNVPIQIELQVSSPSYKIYEWFHYFLFQSFHSLLPSTLIFFQIFVLQYINYTFLYNFHPISPSSFWSFLLISFENFANHSIRTFAYRVIVFVITEYMSYMSPTTKRKLSGATV